MTPRPSMKYIIQLIRMLNQVHKHYLILNSNQISTVDILGKKKNMELGETNGEHTYTRALMNP